VTPVVKDFMQRPKGAIAIATLLAVVAFYLCTIATVLLISPGALSLMSAKYFLYGLELAGPYMMLLGAAVYGAVAWGLFRLQNWARWIAMAELGFPIFWYGLQIAVRVAAAWYLAQAPSVIDAFTAKVE
jgi:hypothetical protein